MKFRIEIEDGLKEEEIIIRCSGINQEIQRIQKAISDSITQQLLVYQGNTEFYLAPEEILFFETEGATVNAHTVENQYQVKYKLYELEKLLPSEFMRISKSTVVNVLLIYSITKNITGASAVEFRNTHKKVYVSRYYYKPLRDQLEEKRRFV